MVYSAGCQISGVAVATRLAVWGIGAICGDVGAAPVSSEGRDSVQSGSVGNFCDAQGVCGDELVTIARYFGPIEGAGHDSNAGL